MDLTKVIEELINLILIQENELEKVNCKLERINQYLEVYEEYIKGEK